jgi:ligand-binding SRPBCC domain-containing protein
MNDFEIVTEIDRPLDEVFAFVERVENVPLYTLAVTDAHETSQGPLGIGSTAVMKGKFLGRGFESTFEMTDYKLNEHFAATTVSGPFEMGVRHHFEATSSGGTKLVSRYHGDFRGFFKLAEPVMSRVTKKQTEASLATLKELLEAGVDRST